MKKIMFILKILKREKVAASIAASCMAAMTYTMSSLHTVEENYNTAHAVAELLPATFQRCMQFVLSGLNPDVALIYIDDVLVHSRTFEAHLANLRSIFGKIPQPQPQG